MQENATEIIHYNFSQLQIITKNQYFKLNFIKFIQLSSKKKKNNKKRFSCTSYIFSITF